MAIFITLADKILEETYYLEALPTSARCRTCGEGKKQDGPGETESHPSHREQASPTTDSHNGTPALSKGRASLAHFYVDSDSLPEVGAPLQQPLYRCTTCGVFVECRECCLERHALSPLHSISV